jgi:hypothetical protein
VAPGGGRLYTEWGLEPKPVRSRVSVMVVWAAEACCHCESCALSLYASCSIGCGAGQALLEGKLGRPRAGRALKGQDATHRDVGSAYSAGSAIGRRPLRTPRAPNVRPRCAGVPCDAQKIRVFETGDFRPQPRACMRVSFRPGKAVLCLVGLHPCPVSKMSGIPAAHPYGLFRIFLRFSAHLGVREARCVGGPLSGLVRIASPSGMPPMDGG